MNFIDEQSVDPEFGDLRQHLLLHSLFVSRIWTQLKHALQSYMSQRAQMSVDLLSLSAGLGDSWLPNLLKWLLAGFKTFCGLLTESFFPHFSAEWPLPGGTIHSHLMAAGSVRWTTGGQEGVVDPAHARSGVNISSSESLGDTQAPATTLLCP